MPAFDESVFWPAEKAAGMLCRARVLLEGATELVCVDVEYDRPDRDLITGARTRDYQMQYQYRDLPRLGEGDQVQITEPDGTVTSFLVREEPFVDEEQTTGFFRRALLTKVE